MLPIRSLSCSPTSSPRLRPRRSLSACEHYAVPRHCQCSELCHYPCCSCKEKFTPSPPIPESRIYENSSVLAQNEFENESRDSFDSREKAKNINQANHQNLDSKQNVHPLTSLETKLPTTSGVLAEANKSQPMSSSELKSSSSEKVTSSGSDDTLVDQKVSSATQYSSRDSNLDNTGLENTAKLSEPNKRLSQNQSVSLNKSVVSVQSDSSTSSPTFLRNSKIDACQKSTDTYRKNSVPKSSSLLRQTLNSQNRSDLNRSDADLRQSPQPSRTPRIVSMIPSSSNVDESYSRHANSSNSSENKNLYQTFSNRYVNSPGSQRHVRINPADLLEYDKRDSRPHSRQDDRNIFKESPVCYRKSNDSSHAEQLNELNRRMTKSHYYSPSSSRNLSLERNSLMQMSDGKVYKSRLGSLYPEFQVEPVSPAQTAFIRRHSSLRSSSPASPMIDRRSAFVKYPTFGYFMPAINYYSDVMGYYAPVSNAQCVVVCKIL